VCAVSVYPHPPRIGPVLSDNQIRFHNVKQYSSVRERAKASPYFIAFKGSPNYFTLDTHWLILGDVFMRNVVLFPLEIRERKALKSRPNMKGTWRQRA